MAAAGPAALGLMVAGQIGQGIDANNAARRDARVLNENARLATWEGEQEAMQTRRDERRMAGAMIAAMAGGGAELGSGTAADLIAESAYQRELEILNLRTRAWGEANNLRQQAADKRAAGRSALVGSIFGAAATALQGAGDMRRDAAMRRAAETGRGSAFVETVPVPGRRVIRDDPFAFRRPPRPSIYGW